MALTKAHNRMIEGAPVNVKDYGAVGDGVTDDTVAIQAALDSASTLDFGDSTYIIVGELTSTKVNQTLLSNGATLKLKASTTCANIFMPSGNGLTIKGILNIDGNRANSGVAATGFNITSSISSSIDSVYAKNVAGIGIRLDGLSESKASNLVSDNCSYGMLLQNLTDTDIINPRVINLNGITASVLQHCIDFWYNTRCKLINPAIIDPDGSTAGQSAWLSGLTLIDLDTCEVSGYTAKGFASTTLKPLAASILSAKHCVFKGWSISGWAGNAHIEYSGCHGNTFDDIKIVEDYTVQAIGAGTESGNYGVFGYNSAEVIAGSNERHQANNSNNRWTDITIAGCNKGFTASGSYDSYDRFTVVGNKVTGIELKWTDANLSYFAAPDNKEIQSISLTNSLIAGNGQRGLHLIGLSGNKLTGTMVNNNRIVNNGQEASTDATATAITAQQTDYTFINNNDLRDTQTFTITDGCSFTPATLATNTKFEITAISNAERYTVGQRIALTGSDSDSSNLTVKIVAKSAFDELTVIPVDFVAGLMTAPLTTKTGTQTVAGTVCTGTGTAYDTEINGRQWMLFAGNYRQIVRVNSATEMILDNAFPSDPVGSIGVNIVEVDVVGIPSQSRCVDAATTSNTNQFVESNGIDGVTDSAYYLTENRAVGETVTVLTSGDATPSVSGGNIYETAGTTTIATFDDGIIGQEIVILAKTSITIATGSGIDLRAGGNFPMVNDDVLTLRMFNDSVWHEVSRQPA